MSRIAGTAGSRRRAARAGSPPARGSPRTSAAACPTRSSPSCGTARPARSPASRSPRSGSRSPSSPVRAVMQTTPEMSVPALVMNCLAPSITHSPSSSRARVRTLPASEPASGSVSPNAPEPPPGVQLGQPLRLLLGRAEQVDRLRPERRVRAHRDRDGRVDPRELLDRDRVGERVAAGAADLLRERDPHQPELAELGDDLVRERLRRGRAPPRPARSRPRRTRGRCDGSARGRAAGRSPSGHQSSAHGG